MMNYPQELKLNSELSLHGQQPLRNLSQKLKLNREMLNII
jgi:hypothetical protein